MGATYFGSLKLEAIAVLMKLQFALKDCQPASFTHPPLVVHQLISSPFRSARFFPLTAVRELKTDYDDSGNCVACTLVL